MEIEEFCKIAKNIYIQIKDEKMSDIYGELLEKIMLTNGIYVGYREELEDGGALIKVTIEVYPQGQNPYYGIDMGEVNKTKEALFDTLNLEKFTSRELIVLRQQITDELLDRVPKDCRGK